jgi:tetratricopeptide (TPR) repeat protein
VPALFVFFASLVVYSWTLAPTVTLVDSGELIVAARSLGVAHPPGFPLYVLLTHLATLVPIGSVAFSVNLASAFFAALACSVVTLAVREAMITARLAISARTDSRKAGRSKSRKKVASSAQSRNDSAPHNSSILVVSCLLSGLLLAFSRTLWSYATIAEVYTLNSLLILVIFLLVFRWRRQFIEASGRRKPVETQDEQTKVRPTPEAAALPPARPTATLPSHSSLYAAAFIFGLALGVHHVSVGLMLPAFAALVLATEGVKFFTARPFLYAALLAFAGLFLVYAYLPLAASRSPIMNWGDPRTFERVWWHVTGRQYQVFFSFSLRTMVSQFSDFIRLAAREFGPWWLPAAPALAIAGLVSIFRHDRPMFWFLALAISADLAYSLGYEIAEDKDAYYLPTFIAMTIAAGFGSEWLIKLISSARKAPKFAGVVAAALVLAVPIAALAGNLPYDNRSRYFIAKDYVDNILSTIEPGGMLLTRDWQVYSPMLYFHEVEHRRDDAIVIDVNQLRRSWYFDYLRRAYPATIAQVSDKVDAFLEDLRHWEHDPDLYQRDLTLNQRINSRFYEMILALVSNHIRSGPVYVTLDIAGNRDGPDAELTRSLAASYQMVPQGLVFQVTTDREFREPADIPLITRGLVDGTVRFDEDDVVNLKILPVYATMLYNRGRYLSANGRHEQAIDSFRQALVLNPRLTVAQQAVTESLNAIRKGADKPQ